MTLESGFFPVKVAVRLHMPNAPWITEVFVTIEWTGLTNDHLWPVSGSATLPAHLMGEASQALGSLAVRAAADKKTEIAEYLARLPKEVK